MEEKSKSAYKREAIALQKIGEDLVALSKNEVEAMDIPETLKNAVLFAQTIKQRGARKRQLQYIGAVMRTLDPEPVRTALDKLSEGRFQANQRFKKIEELRDKIIQGDDTVIDECVGKWPEVDRQKLRQLARNAKKEVEQSGPPKARRALFRYIRDLMEGQESG